MSRPRLKFEEVLSLRPAKIVREVKLHKIYFMNLCKFYSGYIPHIHVYVQLHEMSRTGYNCETFQYITLDNKNCGGNTTLNIKGVSNQATFIR